MGTLSEKSAQARVLSRLWVQPIRHAEVTDSDRAALDALVSENRVTKKVSGYTLVPDVDDKVHAAIKSVLARMALDSPTDISVLYSASLPPLVDAALDRLTADDLVVVNGSTVTRRWAVGLSADEANAVLSDTPPTAPPTPVVSVPDFTDQERNIFCRIVAVPAGAAIGEGESNRPVFQGLVQAGWLVQVEQLRWQFTRPDDSQYTAEELERIRAASAAIVRQLSDPAGTGASSLDGLRKQHGDDAVDAATLRLRGFVLTEHNGRWAVMGGKPRPDTKDLDERRRRAQAKAPTKDEETEPTAASTPAPSPADERKLSYSETVQWMNVMLETTTTLVKLLGGDDGHKVRVARSRKPSVEEVARRIAVLLSAHGPMTKSAMTRNKLSTSQASLADEALEFGHALGAFRHSGLSRWELSDPEPLGMSWTGVYATAAQVKSKSGVA